MAGIYIHIPFCKQACIYCNFHFSTRLDHKQQLVRSLCKELEIRKEYLSGSPIDTVYFGGGTPSLLSYEELKVIMERVYALYSVREDAEVTLEGNPDDLSLDKLQELKASGINRLSIGIQSFFETHLKWMNRAHNEKQAKQVIQDAYQVGFDDFSVDLIFGVPGLTDSQWKKNIDRVIAADVPHVSCYGLTVEPSTVLDHRIRKKKSPPLDEEQSARQYEILMARLGKAGYEQYEISNFAKPGRRARHNSSYWQGIPYLGIGPGAHSYRPHERQWNIANNAIYSKKVADGIIPCEKEILTEKMQWDEYIMTGLRTIEGCDVEYIASHFGEEDKEWLLEKIRPFQALGEVIIDANRIILTRKGRLFGDQISAELFRD